MPETWVRHVQRSQKWASRLLTPRIEPTLEPTIAEGIEDGSRTWVGTNRDEIAAQLRKQYPDGEFERTLRSERDLDAERNYNDALDRLAEIFAPAAVAHWGNTCLRALLTILWSAWRL